MASMNTNRKSRQVHYVEIAMTADQSPSEIFKERLKAARYLREWSQSDLATRAELPPSSIAHFEAGSRKPSFEFSLLEDKYETTACFALDLPFPKRADIDKKIGAKVTGFEIQTMGIPTAALARKAGARMSTRSICRPMVGVQAMKNPSATPRARRLGVSSMWRIR